MSSYHDSLVDDKFGVFELVWVVYVCCYPSMLGSGSRREVSVVISGIIVLS